MRKCVRSSMIWLLILDSLTLSLKSVAISALWRRGVWYRSQSLRLCTTIHTLLVLRRRFSSNTAVHRDFKVCKTSQNIPPLVSLPQRPLRLPEGGGFGFCHSRPGSSDMHTHKNESRDMHTCQTEPPDHTDTHWSPVQKCATVPPLRQSLS